MALRHLALLRHAKSAYPEGVADFDRPLALRGIREAPLAGRWLAAQLPTIDRVIVSSALRTLQTWELADTEVEFNGPLTFDPRVYGATPAELLEVIREVPDSAHSLVLVGHNPGLELLVRLLAGTGDAAAAAAVDAKFPTSAIALLSFDGPWRELTEQSAHLDAFAVAR